MISQHRGKIVRRQSKLRRENIHRSHREQAERDVLAGDPVHDFVDRAVASRGDDFFKAFGGRVPRENFRFARVGGRAEDRSACDRFHLGAQTISRGRPAPRG